MSDSMDRQYCCFKLTEGTGDYNLFVEKRVKKILSHEFIEWKYVPTKQNLAI